MAELICRDYVQVFIGKRGGMTIPVSKRLKNGKFKTYTKRYTSFLSASIDQH